TMMTATRIGASIVLPRLESYCFIVLHLFDTRTISIICYALNTLFNPLNTQWSAREHMQNANLGNIR
ncbi:MAG: hypothetical protein ACFFAZ_10795, partial [Promethearchaeota archaeon]